MAKVKTRSSEVSEDDETDADHADDEVDVLGGSRSRPLLFERVYGFSLHSTTREVQQIE